MLIRAAVNLVVGVHFAFILFAVLGGLLVHRRRWVAWLHVPAALWATLVVLMGWLCPLTPLEHWLRDLGGMETYEGAFLDQYVAPVIYPEGLTRTHQIGLGIFVAALNLVIYGLLLRRITTSPGPAPSPEGPRDTSSTTR